MLRSTFVAFTLFSLLVSRPALAQQGNQQTDALRACVADSTSGKDRKMLARWVFLAIAAHPDMKELASTGAVTATDESSRAMAALVTRLLAESCVTETKAVIKGGQTAEALRLAFEGLGRLAMQELMTDKSVADTMGLFEKYIDSKRLGDALGK